MTATQYVLPNVGTVGIVTLKAPFSGLCAANVPYEVTAVRSLKDIVASGQDPYSLYYSPSGISAADFASDVSNKVCIISLTSSDGEVVYVPNSYFVNLPVATGIAYATMMVAVNLGALPQTLNLSYFMSKVADLAQNLLGVSGADVRAIKASATTYLTIDDSASIEAARQTVMDAVVTDSAQLLQTQNQLNALQSKYNDLEAYVIAHPAS